MKKVLIISSNRLGDSILASGLNKYFNVQYIARKSKSDEHHELNLQNVNVASNIFQFIYYSLQYIKHLFIRFMIKNLTSYMYA